MVKKKFKRKFSLTMYKNLKFSLGKMSFAKDFVNDTRGDLYPIISKSQDAREGVNDFCYIVENGFVQRFVCSFFPYATYEVTATVNDGVCGFCFAFNNSKAVIQMSGQHITFSDEKNNESFNVTMWDKEEKTMLVTCRPGAFDIYLKENGNVRFLTTFVSNEFKDSHQYTNFSNGYVSIQVEGNVVIRNVESYIDNGISTADIRPIRYENGDVIFENGKIYLTASVRLQETWYQGVFSWIPSTAEFELCGAIFYDCGDGFWCNDVAASILYHRQEKKWMLWVCSFAHNHILGHAAFEGDPRFGVNVIDIELVKSAQNDRDITVFQGVEGDEDPDFFYDEKKNKWYMSICRLAPETKEYKYVFFESEKPFEDYKYIGKGNEGAETGGSFVKINNERVFVCGNDFNKTSDYRIYSAAGMENAHFDYPDGGFRGWGSIISIKLGSRTRYFWLTFDRHNGSNYNWSYGNVYCFEME